MPVTKRDYDAILGVAKGASVGDGEAGADEYDQVKEQQHGHFTRR